MGVFAKLFNWWPRQQAGMTSSYFKMLDGYTPIFSTYDGGVYEMELTRSCIHAFATHASKLQPHVSGSAGQRLQKILESRPNFMMTTAQFLYKTATIVEAQNTAFIVPVLNDMDEIIGYYPATPQQIELIDVDGQPWLRYTFGNGQKAAIELYRCGIVSKYLYNHDFMGEDNRALNPTMQMIHTQNEGIQEGIKTAGLIRFLARASNFAKPEDLAKYRKTFVEENFKSDNGGLVVFPNTMDNIQQVQSHAALVDPEQMRIIQDRVFSYFGCNDSILQNKAVGDAWSAYYEGKIEPFLVQLSLAMTCMTFSPRERATGNEIVWAANRLQYMSNAEKLNVSQGLFDRGILSTNDVMDIWQLPHVEDGEKRYIRKEYAEISQLDAVADLQAQLDSAKNALNASGASAQEGDTDDPSGNS